ncbi:MAG: TetR/AcrR family transcriptional regulator [Oscillospiraceae bacterium]|nr:TetR/AcrR family transcriptional regulator [Oscillospiraceae bacterium]
MTRREEIIFATLELASEYGLGAVSLSQIAEKIGIKKPSLYNHFESKEQIIDELYKVLEEKVRTGSNPPLRYELRFTDMSLEEILMACLPRYLEFLTTEDTLRFIKVLYSERSISHTAARIMFDETERLTGNIKNLFYALVLHGKMKNEGVDEAALSFALTIRSLTERHMDMIRSGLAIPSGGIEIPEKTAEYIKWFCRYMEAENVE